MQEVLGSCEMLSRQAYIYSRRVLGSLQSVYCSASHMASQAAPRDAALRDEPHDSQASKKPLRKKIKRALEQMTAEQMDAESEQSAVAYLGAQPPTPGSWDASHTACISRNNGIALLTVAGAVTHGRWPQDMRSSSAGQLPGAVNGRRTVTVACVSVQADRSAPGCWHSPCLSTRGGWACSCTAPAYKRSTQSRWSRPRLQQVRLSSSQQPLFGSPVCTSSMLLPPTWHTRC